MAMNDALINAFGWTLFHALWQALLLIVPFLLSNLAGHNPHRRYGVLTIGLSLLPLMSLGTFLYYMAAPEKTSVVEGVYLLEAMTTKTLPSTGIEGYFPLAVQIWFAGAILSILRIAGGWFYAQRLTEFDASDAPPFLQQRFEELKRSLHLNKDVILRLSYRTQIPMVIGHLKPVVLLPFSVATGLRTEEVEAILLHELGHVRRNDYLINLLQTLVESLYFFHPVVWWFSSQIREVREHCCDDIAVSATGKPLDLAKALTHLQEVHMKVPTLAMAIKDGSLMGRVKRLMQPHYSPTRVGRVTMTLLFGLGLTTLAATTTVFSDEKAPEPVEPVVAVPSPEAVPAPVAEPILATSPVSEPTPEAKPMLASEPVAPSVKTRPMLAAEPVAPPVPKVKPMLSTQPKAPKPPKVAKPLKSQDKEAKKAKAKKEAKRAKEIQKIKEKLDAHKAKFETEIREQKEKLLALNKAYTENPSEELHAEMLKAQAVIERKAMAMEAEVAQEMAAYEKHFAEYAQQKEREMHEHQAEELQRQAEMMERQVEDMARQNEAYQRQIEEVERQREDQERHQEAFERQHEERERQAEEMQRQAEEMEAQAQDYEAQLREMGERFNRGEISEEEKKAHIEKMQEFKKAMIERRDAMKAQRAEMMAQRESLAGNRDAMVSQRKMMELKRQEMELHRKEMMKQRELIDRERVRLEKYRREVEAKHKAEKAAAENQ